MEENPQLILDALAKPVGSLAGLESWAARLRKLSAGEITLRKSRLLLFAGDHGSLKADSSLSAYPREVTAAMFQTVLTGKAACGVIASAVDVDIELIDVGVDADLHSEESHVTAVCVAHCKVMRGTRNMLIEPAMHQHECAAAMEVGRDAVKRAAQAGANVLCIGELGLGNTTSAAALLASLAPLPVHQAVGAGSGLDKSGIAHKKSAVTSALHANQAVGAVEGPLGWLRAVGGLEIAAMVGSLLEASALSIPVVVDGFISGAAALAAVRVEPTCARIMFLSHKSAEFGARALLSELEAVGAGKPALDMGLRLGEGTGALLVVPILRAAASLFSMATLKSVLNSRVSKL